VSAWPDLLDALPFLPDSEHIWHLIEALAFPVAVWELFKYLYRWIVRRRSRLEQKLELVETETREKTEEIHKLRSENQQLSAELESAKSRLPQAAIARADRESRDRNTVAAVRQLETWFENNAESVTAIALRLAKFHISRAIPDPGNHLDRARDLFAACSRRLARQSGGAGAVERARHRERRLAGTADPRRRYPDRLEFRNGTASWRAG
jgi:hypothetical protein